MVPRPSMEIFSRSSPNSSASVVKSDSDVDPNKRGANFQIEFHVAAQMQGSRGVITGRQINFSSPGLGAGIDGFLNGLGGDVRLLARGPEIPDVKDVAKASPFTCARRNEADTKTCKAKHARTVSDQKLLSHHYLLRSSSASPEPVLSQSLSHQTGFENRKDVSTRSFWSYQTAGVISSAPHQLIT